MPKTRSQHRNIQAQIIVCSKGAVSPSTGTIKFIKIKAQIAK